MLRMDELPERPNIAIPVWADRMELSVRSDFPLATLRFLAVVPSPAPQSLLETARIQLSHGLLKSIVDVICRNTKYFPTPESVQPESNA
jgi:hypothetical protein